MEDDHTVTYDSPVDKFSTNSQNVEDNFIQTVPSSNHSYKDLQKNINQSPQKSNNVCDYKVLHNTDEYLQQMLPFNNHGDSNVSHNISNLSDQEYPLLVNNPSSSKVLQNIDNHLLQQFPSNNNCNFFVTQNIDDGLTKKVPADSFDCNFKVPLNIEDYLLQQFKTNSLRNFNVVGFNAQSLLAHFQDVKFTFSGPVTAFIHAILICETFITPTTHPALYDLPGYKSIRVDKEYKKKANGGVLIYLRNDIFHEVINTSSGDFGFPEYVFIQAKYFGETIFLGAIYIPPSVKENFECIPFHLQRKCNKAALMGDLNLCQFKIDLKKLNLDSILNSAGLYILPIASPGTNHEPKKKSSAIDLTITSNVNDIESYGNIPSCFSYHDLLYASLKVNPVLKEDSQVTFEPPEIKQSDEIKRIRSKKWEHKSMYLKYRLLSTTNSKYIEKRDYHLNEYQKLHKLWIKYENYCKKTIMRTVVNPESSSKKRKDCPDAYFESLIRESQWSPKSPEI